MISMLLVAGDGTGVLASHAALGNDVSRCAMSLASDWDPLDSASLADPTGYDNAIRRKCPVAYTEQFGGFWGLFDHASVTAATRDTEAFLSSPTQMWPRADIGVPWLPLQSDPPDHRQYRRPLVPFFRGERIESFRPRLRQLTNELIDAFVERGHANVAAELDIPLPAMGLCLLLHLPEDRWTNFYRWSTLMAEAARAGDAESIGRCFAEIKEFADEWILDRRQHAFDDVVDAMLRARIDDRPWTDDEIRGTFTLLFSAGHQTTADALNFAVKYLAEHPGDREKLIAAPELIPAAAVEFVRLSAPVRALARTTACPVTMHDRTIPAGSPVVMMWGAASRDEAYYDDPDVFNLERDNRNMIAFGSGVHRCLGEEFAKLEIEVALEEFLRRIPHFELVGTPERTGWPTNGYSELNISFPPGGRAGRPM